ncbi:hypothetical protein B0H34DRAFT_513467 [Crassisporium funariophilum]|nr:hypothetical protein B0H34DRAFT_513467 [Crassisporium funariophilum]
MSAFYNMNAISIKAETTENATQDGRDIFSESAPASGLCWSMVFLSAERLTSRDVAGIPNGETIRANVVIPGIRRLLLWLLTTLGPLSSLPLSPSGWAWTSQILHTYSINLGLPETLEAAK